MTTSFTLYKSPQVITPAVTDVIAFLSVINADFSVFVSRYLLTGTYIAFTPVRPDTANLFIEAVLPSPYSFTPLTVKLYS